MAEAVSDIEQKYGRLPQLTLVIDMNRCLVSTYIYLFTGHDLDYICIHYPHPYLSFTFLFCLSLLNMDETVSEVQPNSPLVDLRRWRSTHTCVIPNP